ncbi:MULTISPECIES: helix-turn-helix domain-containing protein [Parvimonas]|uniref:Helix-turn-helix transcriptional regulator n=1 Tax=Parvimonas micra TaxID=33033 RepID=A0A930E1L9_9FIRM|nr:MULTISPECIES: helix-turn-helix domain-containing protein [Parvimonas]MBF1307347.1 helix-turn-helix transcriptional regulator [Parvimonas micra]MCZ7409289.1 helix-turn-helix transcriptional regulator [Parvimonas micra]MEB3025089.1 helix-turn-helix domain-containing protein [Parvimonas sp. M13]MEB3073288.1 helix-turn-helix domain-containing protein [Parvimonas sp. C2]MEB3089255.1 helix-turn-helix domain-containing protein [Parvimonas sp. M20]
MSTIYDKCPYVTTQKVLQGKWAIVVLYHLSTGTKRFNELERLIPEVTRTVLTRQLRQLEQDKLITRKVFAEVPPHVEYSLSTLGTKFQKVLNEIEIFGLDYISELNKINNPKDK